MRLPLYQVDAFTAHRFGGNPAAVVPLEHWPEDELLRAIAAENNLSETAYLVPRGGDFELRWFTPTLEIDLCGHATLAAAAVLFARLEPGRTSVRFHTRKAGELGVRAEDGWLELDFPARPPHAAAAPAGLLEALGGTPVAVLASTRDWLVRYASEREVAALAPRMEPLRALGPLGVIATAPGDACDFVSRFFAPGAGVDEDPVTGSAHCVLTPYWSRELAKSVLDARQISRRLGLLRCSARGERVGIAGQVAFYLEGTIEV